MVVLLLQKTGNIFIRGLLMLSSWGGCSWLGRIVVRKAGAALLRASSSIRECHCCVGEAARKQWTCCPSPTVGMYRC